MTASDSSVRADSMPVILGSHTPGFAVQGVIERFQRSPGETRILEAVRAIARDAALRRLRPVVAPEPPDPPITRIDNPVLKETNQ